MTVGLQRGVLRAIWEPVCMCTSWIVRQYSRFLSVPENALMHGRAETPQEQAQVVSPSMGRPSRMSWTPA